ncbi:vitamin B6 photo-protection and homoeostasis-domain-containing protein [Exophiala viscosa]|uniref:vitamin B6 photo-protection and homoeostasis-domain-containing protein n=1 Tax=Exophiala viscosa TaxID=2486360 RepID=UPI00219AD501|nr:vitamin B6 photo-protection and homoeostasis-domain-containing protein [Exophiala viscosa]
MAATTRSQLAITELDAEGSPEAIYTLQSGTNNVEKRSVKTSTPAATSLLLRCMSAFLPAGYPATVTPDYTPYQIYDSAQAFASTIAGLLASRAVFVGMGVGSEDASLVTTMLLYIAQETIGRVATILFAHQFSQRIAAEVKFYRFFADIVNDIAFVLDCMSPGLPIIGRVLTLCVSNAFRAMCGVAGGSSKAILSAHFAKAGNIGELNAKDGSQETMLSLVGMWVGGLVVSKVHGTAATWSCLIPLLALHLWANWKAVKSVRLNSLNAERARIVFGGMLRGQLQSLDDVNQEEAILRPSAHSVQVGVSFKKFFSFMHDTVNAQSESEVYGYFGYLLEIFANEEYLLWLDMRNGNGMVILKASANGETQAKSFCHALRCRHQRDSLPGSTAKVLTKQENFDAMGQPSPARAVNSEAEVSFQVLVATLQHNKHEWSKICNQAQDLGWNLDLTNLVGRQGCRIQVEDDAGDNKKDI